jgi:vancomycin permeability regulator SanA
VSSLRHRLQRVLLVLMAGFALQWLASDRMLVWVGESEMVTRLSTMPTRSRRGCGTTPGAACASTLRWPA